MLTDIARQLLKKFASLEAIAYKRGDIKAAQVYEIKQRLILRNCLLSDGASESDLSEGLIPPSLPDREIAMDLNKTYDRIPKPINKKRIIAALNHLQSRRIKVCESDGEVIAAVALYGLKSMAKVANETDRFKLGCELSYQDVEPTDLEVILNRWDRNIKRFADWGDRIFDIQERYGVSGLAEVQTQLGSEVITHIGEDEQLVLIPSDLPKMNDSKMLLLTKWIDYCVLNGLSLWTYDAGGGGYWKAGSLQEVTASAPFYDWAKVSERVSYLSESRMRRQGYDEHRQESKYPDDKKHWEVHLVLGSGTNSDAPSSSVWFCGCNEKPYL